ncbi:MAG: tetratricopeptide repeat protein [Gammaproteobacteria bacterium]|nr:tetratricopeptide repeat protein [Gammaproteobacteria bacterium]
MLEAHRLLLSHVTALFTQTGSTSASHTLPGTFRELVEETEKLKQCLERVDSIPGSDFPAEVDGVCNIAQFLGLEMGEYSSGLNRLQSLYARTAEDDKNRFRILSTLGRLYLDRYEHLGAVSDLLSAQAVYREYARICTTDFTEGKNWELGNAHSLARTLILMSAPQLRLDTENKYAIEANRLLDAVIAFRGILPESESERAKNERLRRLGNSYVEKGLAQASLGQDAEGISWLQKALAIARELPENMRWVEIAWCSHRLGQLYAKAGNVEQAWLCYTEALAQLENQRSESSVHLRVVDILYNMGAIASRVSTASVAEFEGLVKSTLSRMSRLNPETECVRFQLQRLRQVMSREHTPSFFPTAPRCVMADDKGERYEALRHIATMNFLQTHSACGISYPQVGDNVFKRIAFPDAVCVGGLSIMEPVSEMTKLAQYRLSVSCSTNEGLYKSTVVSNAMLINALREAGFDAQTAGVAQFPQIQCFQVPGSKDSDTFSIEVRTASEATDILRRLMAVIKTLEGPTIFGPLEEKIATLLQPAASVAARAAV